MQSLIALSRREAQGLIIMRSSVTSAVVLRVKNSKSLSRIGTNLAAGLDGVRHESDLEGLRETYCDNVVKLFATVQSRDTGFRFD